MSTPGSIIKHVLSEIGRFCAFTRGFSENYLTLLLAAIVMALVRTTMYPGDDVLQITAAAFWSIIVMLFWSVSNYRMRFYCTKCRELTEDDSEFPGLLSRIRQMADNCDIKLKRVVITSPKSSDETGYRYVSLGKAISPTGEVALADVLLRVLPEEERLAVAAHELGHLSRPWPLYNPIYYPAVGAAMGIAFAAHPLSVVWPAALGVGLHLAGRMIHSPKRPWVQMMLAHEHKLADQAAAKCGANPEMMLKAYFRKSVGLFGDSSALKIIMDWSSTPHGRYLINYLADYGSLSDDQVYDIAREVIREESQTHAWVGASIHEEKPLPAAPASEA